MQHSAGIIIFRTKEEQRQYLLLKSTYKNTFWGFSKGNIEMGETEKQTALREAEEETGLKKVTLLSGFKEKTSYFKTVNGKQIYKEVTWFLGEAKDKNEGKISEEHEELRWLSYDGALQLLTHQQEKELLTKAEKVFQ